MRLLLLYVAVSSSAFMGALGDIVQLEASIEIPSADIKKVVENPNGQYRGYKIINEIDGEVYIGGRETLIIYNAKDYELRNTSENYTFEAEEINVFVTCEKFIGEQNSEKICQHYIRLAEKIGDDLLVCGTNKQTPRCHYMNMTSEGTIVSNFTADRTAQHSVTQNTTSKYYDGHLYLGFSEGTQPNPSHVSKFLVQTDDLVKVAETDDQNENFVNEPHFVGKPYVKGKYMYFFYRETAVEVVNQGKFVYSRVARICLNDDGVNSNFEIFLKARLNCSLQGQYPFYFNHIQDVIFEEEGDDTIFYGVFTTTPHGPSSSAVCTYKLSDIDRVFNTSKFKGKEAPGKLPGPVNRPSYAEKILNCEKLSNAERTFLRKNPLMDDLVPNFNAKNQDSRGSDWPLFYSTSMNFYSIAVHTVDGEKYFYVGTEHGTIIKAYHNGSMYVFYEQQIWVAKSAVTGLRVDDATQTLLVVTAEGLFVINLAACNAYCARECQEFYKPYCRWTDGSCKAVGSQDTENPNAVNNSVKILALKQNEKEASIMSCNSRKVELTCEVKSSTLCDRANLVWMLGDNEVLVNCTGESKCRGKISSVGHLIQFREIVNKPYYKLVHLTVDVHKNKTSGTFTCLYDQSSRNSKESVTISVEDSKGCLTEELYNQRRVRREKLQWEKDSLDDCMEPGQTISSEDVMFTRCSECPGNPKIDENA